jgi:hypothetical protein
MVTKRAHTKRPAELAKLEQLNDYPELYRRWQHVQHPLGLVRPVSRMELALTERGAGQAATSNPVEIHRAAATPHPQGSEGGLPPTHSRRVRLSYHDSGHQPSPQP